MTNLNTNIKKSKIVISVGDESGIGPEVILKAIGSREYPKDIHTQIVGLTNIYLLTQQDLVILVVNGPVKGM